MPHPLFDWNRKVGLRHKLRLAKLALSGVRLQTRTHDQSIRLNSSQVRSLLRAEGEDGILREILAEETVTSCPFFETGSSFARPSDPWMLEAGRRTPNPMYRHLFDAYTFRTEGLPSLKIQLEKWKGFVRPLEDDDVPWGLTPWTTYQHFREPIEAWLGGNRQSTEANLHSLQLKEEGQKLSSVKKFLSGIEGIRVPAEVSTLRELWTLLLSYRDLFWEVEIP
ncbi:MAG: hypothetical protein EBZ49_06945 [Proteobacteria bacterium]|nr:hypothetical protein [Pseudomonadota bacterium]